MAQQPEALCTRGRPAHRSGGRLGLLVPPWATTGACAERTCNALTPKACTPAPAVVQLKRAWFI
eukprot:1143728-Pelagomonas_calceolata.AAC.3